MLTPSRSIMTGSYQIVVTYFCIGGNEQQSEDQGKLVKAID